MMNFEQNLRNRKHVKKSPALPYDLAGMGGCFEEIDIDKEYIDLDVVPDQIPLDSAAGEDTESLPKTDGKQTRGKFADSRPSADSFSQVQDSQADIHPVKDRDLHTGRVTPTRRLSLSHLISEAHTDSGQSPISDDISPLQEAISMLQKDENDSRFMSTQTDDSGYGSISLHGPRPSRKSQTKQVIGEPYDIIVERSIIETSLNQGTEDVTETQTLYPEDRSVMGTNKTRQYILEFANYLYCQFQEQLTDDSIERMTTLLPELLVAFALKLGQTSQSQIKRDAMYFVHTHRNQITQSMRALFNKERSISSSVVKADDECSSEDISRYRDAATKDPAYEWLIGKLNNELNLTEMDLSDMKNISSYILNHLPPVPEVSRLHPSKPIRVTFSVDCDIFGFIQKQGYYPGDAAEIVPKVITLTGSTMLNVQATTCEQYLLQTWPTVGCNLLQAIQGALREYNAYKPLQNSYKCKFVDRTEIKVFIGKRYIEVEALGTIHSIAEIGEQIGWLATAFSQSYQDSEILFCHPQIYGFKVEQYTHSHSMEEEFDEAFVCRVSVLKDKIRGGLPLTNGQCWRKMFNNPVIVKGYPIKPRRNLEPETGLELPFDMMTTLADARYLTTFDDKTVVKGFSTMLIPMKQQNDVFIWHFLMETDGKRISYQDPRTQQGILIPFDNIRGARHILGWCANAQNNIGSPNAKYDIKSSGLTQGRGGLAWEGVELSVGAGNYFKVSSTFKRGKKDRSICNFVPDGYTSLVEHIGQHHIVLYDVKEKRAWLSDGLPVLLHLVRTSLTRDEIEDPGGLYTNHIKKLKEAPPSTQGTMAAKAVLFDSENRLASLRLADTKVTERTIEETMNGKTVEKTVKITESTYYRFENRVEEISLLLEKSIDQIGKAIHEGALRGTPRSILGGFDFVSVATRSKLRLIATKVHIAEYGSGWTNLVDSLEAITLFGNNFGELIKPGVGNSTESCNNCGFEASLPSGKNRLAVCVDVLEKILEMNGNEDTTPWRLIDDLHWHGQEAAFRPCRCTSFNIRRRGSTRDRVQILSSRSTFQGVRPANPIDIERNGAVIFGHSRTRPFQTNCNTVADETASSPDDNTQLHAINTSLEMSTSSAAQDESSEINENQLSDTASSTTPGTSTSSRTDGSGSNNTTVDQQSPTSNVVPAKSETIAAPPQNVSVALPQASHKRSLGRIKDMCARAWKKLKRRKKTARWEVNKHR